MPALFRHRPRCDKDKVLSAIHPCMRSELFEIFRDAQAKRFDQANVIVDPKLRLISPLGRSGKYLMQLQEEEMRLGLP